MGSYSIGVMIFIDGEYEVAGGATLCSDDHEPAAADYARAMGFVIRDLISVVGGEVAFMPGDQIPDEAHRLAHNAGEIGKGRGVFVAGLQPQIGYALTRTPDNTEPDEELWSASAIQAVCNLVNKMLQPPEQGQQNNPSRN